MANRKAEAFVLENELPRATPTIQKAVADIIDAGWHPSITNICESFGEMKSIEHEACAAIDISKRGIGNQTTAKEYLESLDLVCESHFNYSGVVSPDEDMDSHWHCVDAIWREEYRIGYKLPEKFEPWKHEIAEMGATMALERGVEPKYIVAAMVRESGITPDAIGDNGCAKGVLQWNECAKKSPAPDTEGQITAWLDNFIESYEKSGSWEDAVVDWNYPSIDENWNQTKYWRDYKETLDSITPS